MGLSDIVWVDVRCGSQAKTKTKQAMQLKLAGHDLWRIVGHFDMEKSHEQTKFKIFSKCHKGYSLGVLVHCDISVTVRYIGHTMSTGACRWHAPIYQ